MMLRVKEPEQADQTINWASDFEFDVRWPPDEADESATSPSRDALTRNAIEALEAAGSRVYQTTDDEPRRRLLAEHEGEVYRLLVTPGWVVDGRVRFVDRSERPVDCFFVYCDELDQLYVIPDDEFDSTITLRVEEPKKGNRRTKYATDYEFGINWPPNAQPHPDHPLNLAISEVVECFERNNCGVEYDRDDGTIQTLRVDTPDGRQYRVRIENGWLEDGRVRFVPNGNDIDYYVVYSDQQDELYIVTDDAFETSFTFRVDPPEIDDPQINWADDYRLEDNWPP